MMPKQVPVSSTNSMYNLTVSNQEGIRPVGIVADSTSYLNLFCQEIDDRFEIGEVPALTLSKPDAARIPSWGFQSEPTTPVSLPPGSSASSPISTHELDLTWDSPCTPQTPLQRGYHANRELATPLTPPESSESISKHRVDVAELASGTPSRKDPKNDESNVKNDMHKGKLGASVRRLQPLFESSQL